MSVYCVALINIRDREGFGRYQGQVLAVDEAVETLEGEWPWTRTVLLRFPDRDALRAWYDSPDYQALMQHRTAASSAAIGIVTALD